MEEALTQNPFPGLRITLYGPESTGKTTLCKMLAAHYNTRWVPEFARSYLQQKWDEQQEVCGREDIPSIAAGQMKLENQNLEEARGILFCDTNLLETAVYSSAYFDGYCDPVLLKQALKAHYDLYFLTYIDLPWVQDDLRDRPYHREPMFRKFKKALDDHNKPYQILRGSLEERFSTAVRSVEELIKKKKIGL